MMQIFWKYLNISKFTRIEIHKHLATQSYKSIDESKNNLLEKILIPRHNL